MDKDILKLFPQKAFKLLSIKESLRISAVVTKSVFDKDSYENLHRKRSERWGFTDIKLVQKLPLGEEQIFTKEDGEKVLKIYFAQFFEKNLAVHLDLRKNNFLSSSSFYWVPSKLHYNFSAEFSLGVSSLYKGFYLDSAKDFEKGLIGLGIIKDSMSEVQKKNMEDLFYKHFGEGRVEAVSFSLEKLQMSFNAIFAHFLRENIPLNPEFAVLGISLVTLYLNLQEIPYALDVSGAFNEVLLMYQKDLHSNSMFPY